MTFTASNDIKVTNLGGNWDTTKVLFEGHLRGLAIQFANERTMVFEDSDFEALREYFRHEEDERLGRWRSTDSDIVVYHKTNVNGDHKVLNLRTGYSILWGRDMEPSPGSVDHLEGAAAEYFEAHPVKRPWHEAKPGESWVLTFESGEEEAQTVNREGDFYPWVLEVTADYIATKGKIVSGRKIWPKS